MKKLLNKSGFTLIEIIVVLIIVGILAAIALPNLFANVAKSRAEEALATIATYRPTIEGCIIKNGTAELTCNTTNLGAPASSQNFTYALAGPTANIDTSYSIVASGINNLGAGDQLTVARGATTFPAILTTVTCVGVGQLQGAC